MKTMRTISFSLRSIAVLLPVLTSILVKAENLNSFLSASFSTSISPVDDAIFGVIRQEAFCNASSHFFQKVFDDHNANVNILSVGVFDEHTYSKKSVQAEKLQYRQYPREHSLSFSTVIVAQYSDEDQQPLMSTEHFRQNIFYTSNDFQTHFLTFLQESEDLYFSGVNSVVFGDYQANKPDEVLVDLDNTASNNNIMGMSIETLNTFSIIVVVVSSVLSAIFLFASVKLHQKRKELIYTRWESQDVNLATAKSVEAHPSDQQNDLSFDPLVVGDSYNKNYFADERDASTNHATPSPLFEPETSKNSYSEELESLPRHTISLPPGKLGVAIDIINGQAVVKKIRKGSPITGILLDGDIILSIDDVDCSCMTLAEVTFLMVKNMERVRRVTFVRRS